MRASGSGCVISFGPFAGDSAGSGAPSAIPCAVSPSMRRRSASSKCDSLAARSARRSEFGSRPYGIVRREQDLLGRDLPHQVDEVDDAPHRGVEEHSRHVREVARQPAEVGDAGVGDDQPDAGVALDESCEVVADRRQPAAAVNQDRHVALDREREDGVEPLVADRELLGAGMELDPAGAEVEAAPGLLDRASPRGRGARTG